MITGQNEHIVGKLTTFGTRHGFFFTWLRHAVVWITLSGTAVRISIHIGTAIRITSHLRGDTIIDHFLKFEYIMKIKNLKIDN